VATGAPATASPARECAMRVVRRVFEQGAYADRALAAEAQRLAPRERALATQLAYGTVQRRATLDHVAERLVERPLEKLDQPVLAALRIGLFQLLYLDGIAEHAAVNESVALVKGSGRRGAGLVNAVLRRGVTEGRAIVEELDDDEPESAAILHSVPVWLARLWWSELGARQARELLRRVNEPAESAVRVNTLLSTPRAVRSQLPVASRDADGLPEGLVLEGPFDAHGSELWREGAIMPQSRGSMLVARVLGPAPGDRVLDLCAAPGGKTTHLAALMGGRGEVIAVERHAGRARALARTCARMRADRVRVEVADAASALSVDGRFDRVLVDPPCSGLGTLQSRPDLRWRASEAGIARLALLQSEILAAGAAALSAGGTLVYSVCTISRGEGEQVIERFLDRHPTFVADELGRDGKRQLQLRPDRDGTDGFFIARLRALP
jgi:16S rRNA (cytosine967-C5)-methyltransferase